MRHVVVAMLMLLGGADLTWETARTQAELNQMGGRDRDAAKQRMEAELGRILALAKDDAGQVGRVRAAQVAWEAYRTAQLDALYGCDGWTRTYGSAAPMCAAMAEAAMYARRGDELKAIVAHDETDICGWRPTCGP